MSRKDATATSKPLPSADLHESSKSGKASKNNNKQQAASAPLLARLLSGAQRIVQGVAVVLLCCFLVNWLLLTWRLAAVRRELASDATLQWINVRGSSVPISVRCQVVGPRVASVFVIPGAGASWLFGALPLWPLAKLMPGVEHCSYARPALPLTGGWPVNSTETDVSIAVELVEKLVEPSVPLFVVGHSMGGVLAPLVVKQLTRHSVRGVAIFDPACAFASDSAHDTYAELAASLAKRLRIAEVLSSFGVMTALQSHLEATTLAPILAELPHQYRDAYLYAAVAQQTYAGLANDMERLNSTIVALRNAVAASGGAPLLGDVPVVLLHATAPRWPHAAVDVGLDEHMDRHKSDSLFNNISSRVSAQTIEGADHMFHSRDDVILKTLSAVISLAEPTVKALRQSQQ